LHLDTRTKKILTNESSISKLYQSDEISTKRISFNLNLANRYEKLNPELYPPKRRSSAEETSKSPNFLITMQFEESHSTISRKKSLSLEYSYLCKNDISGIFSFRNELLKMKNNSIDNSNFIFMQNKNTKNYSRQKTKKNYSENVSHNFNTKIKNN